MLIVVGSLAAALAGCGEQAHRLVGAFILNSSAVDSTDTGCSGTGEYADITDGLGVVVRNESGSVVGSAALVYDARGSATQCVYTWAMTVGAAESYTIKVGARDAGTYTTEELDGRYWQVATTLGE